VSAEEEKRAFLGLMDALTLSVAPPPPLGPPPRTQPRHATSNEVWDTWPVVETPVASWLPALTPRPPPPPMAAWPWPWPQRPFIDLSDDDEDEDDQA
jgi:hypothetical protein